MAGEEAQETFSVNLDGDLATQAERDAESLERLRSSIEGAQEKLKDMNSALRSVRGKSDEATSAREKLKAAIESERSAVSSANLALLKQGATYERLTRDAKKLETEKLKLKKLAEQERKEARDEAIKDAAKAAKEAAEKAAEALKHQQERTRDLINTAAASRGPLGGVANSLKAVSELGGEAGLVEGAMVTAIGLVAAAAAGLVIGLGSLTYSTSKWIVVQQDALRNMNLMRLAATGSAQNAANLGTQVDALAEKLSTPREKLNELSVELRKNVFLSGTEIVDAFQTVGRASDAMGDSVGKTLEDIMTRGQRFQRFQINPQELFGTGIKFQDVAGELAKQLGVGEKQAQQAIYEGRVRLDAGIKALKATVEKRFGEVNAKKLLSLDAIGVKFHETLQNLTKDVNFERVAKPAADLLKEFDQAHFAGVALKRIIDLLGEAIGVTFEKGMPVVKQGFKGLVIGALDVAIAALQLRNTLRDAFGPDTIKGIDLGKVALETLKLPLDALAVVIKTIAGNISVIAGVGQTIGNAFGVGISKGIATTAPQLKEASEKAAGTVEKATRDRLDVHSPSRVGVAIGREYPRGVAIGIDRGGGEVERASRAMGGIAADVGASGGGQAASGAMGGRGMVVHVGGISIPIVVQGGDGTAGKQIAKQLSEPSFLSKLTKAIEEAARQGGIPTDAALP